MSSQKHIIEDKDSWETHLKQQDRRKLRHTGRHRAIDAEQLEREKEAQFQVQAQQDEVDAAKLRKQQRKEHDKMLTELWRDPGIDRRTVHGLMIDAGSTGSRLHIYEWAPRILRTEDDINDAVTGNKLSFPGTESRWTDRLRPGIASFGSQDLSDEQLEAAIADYLQPLLDFAKTILHEKQVEFGTYPIFLRATAGMRILEPQNRARVIQTVRNLFNNKTYCPFAFVDEQARVLSGEEEAIYDWTGVNFLLGDLLEQSEGAGTVINPKQTHGALDLGGASTQISFYEPNEDIMSNLFKLQIGQAKHWNVYAHSFLFYGMNEAISRFQAKLSAGKTSYQRLVEGIYNPCLAGGVKHEIRTNIHFTASGDETWGYNEEYPSGDGSYQAVLKNDHETGDFDRCMELTESLLHLEKNDWCEFAHKGDCSLAGIYQPELPSHMQDESFGEFVAFSNFYHVWRFLHLPERATIGELYNATRSACSMNHNELVAFNEGRVPDEELDSYCFRSTYVYQLLRNGYGFRTNDKIRVTKVINGHKVGWALGAMLYEINSMPWRYAAIVEDDGQDTQEFDSFLPNAPESGTFFVIIALSMLLSLVAVFHRRRTKNASFRYEYEPIKEVEV
jgi:Golgi nucleoside diphosphatase